ncbi:hypothetical protein K450DRAFT_263398, partial [Umbelopsis ramanniana AG]
MVMNLVTAFLIHMVVVFKLVRAGILDIPPANTVPTPISFSNYTVEWKDLDIILENAEYYRRFQYHLSQSNDTRPRTNAPHAVYDRLKSLADQALVKPLYTVTSKPFLPPSGDKRDLITYAPYWWPAPDCNANDNTNDCPYIRIDGKVNPDVYKLDDQRHLESVTLDSEILAMASVVFDDDVYSQKAADMLRYFFLNEETKMNPNFEYSQIIRGNGKTASHTGRSTGVIIARCLVGPIRAIKFLQLRNSYAWSHSDTAGMISWYKELHNWMIHDTLPIQESKSKNNHLTYFITTLITISDFIGDFRTIEDRVNTFFAYSLAEQIKVDGVQPIEEGRTLPYHYTTFNLDGLVYLAAFVSRSDPPLIENAWNRTGSSIVRAVNRLIDVARGNEGRIEPGADLSDADIAVRAVGMRYPELYCGKYHANQHRNDPYLNLWPLWTPRQLWYCFQ